MLYVGPAMTTKANKTRASPMFTLLRTFTPLSSPLYTEKITTEVINIITIDCVNRLFGRSNK